jgi:hypothetical protein
MKVYVYEYDFEIMKANSFKSEIEHRVESFTDFNDFIRVIEKNQGKWYISNEKTYAGTINEIDISKVLNPLGI